MSAEKKLVVPQMAIARFLFFASWKEDAVDPERYITLSTGNILRRYLEIDPEIATNVLMIGLKLLYTARRSILHHSSTTRLLFPDS